MDKEEFWDRISKPYDYRKSCWWCVHLSIKGNTKGARTTNHRASSGYCTYPNIHPGFGCVLQDYKHFQYDSSQNKELK